MGNLVGRGAFLLTVALGALASAAAQDVETEEDEVPVAERASNWSLITQVSWTDNYRRLPEALVRNDIDGGAGTVTPVLASIDPQENVILTAALRGTSFVRAKRFTGFVTGGLRLGAYLDGTDDEADLVAESVPAAPFALEPDANGSFSTFSFGDIEDVFIVPDLVGAATLELTEGEWYLDASGLARESTIGRSSVVNRRGASPGQDTVTYVGGSVSPYRIYEFGDGQMTELRGRVTAVAVADERRAIETDLPGVDFLPAADQLANDSLSAELSGAYSSGGRYDKVTYGLSGIARHISENGSDVLPSLEVREISGRADAAYALSRAVALKGTLGYDHISLDFDNADEAVESAREDDVSGVYWNIGLMYEPSRRVSVELLGGERYGGPSLEGRTRIELARRVTFNASALRVFDTGGQQFTRVLNGIQTRTRSVLSDLTGAQGEIAPEYFGEALGVEPLGRSLDQEFRSGAFVFDRVAASLLAQFGRTELGAGASFSSAEAGDADEETLTFSAFALRRLSRRLTVRASYAYAENEGVGIITSLDGTVLGQGDRRSTDHFARAGLEYSLGRRLSGTIDVNYAQNDAEGAIDPGAGYDFDETAVIVGLRWAF